MHGRCALNLQEADPGRRLAQANSEAIRAPKQTNQTSKRFRTSGVRQLRCGWSGEVVRKPPFGHRGTLAFLSQAQASGPWPVTLLIAGACIASFPWSGQICIASASVQMGVAGRATAGRRSHDCHAGYASTWRGRWQADKGAAVRNRRCGRHWAAISTRHVVLCTTGLDDGKKSRGAIEWHRHFTRKFRLIETPRLTGVERGKRSNLQEIRARGKQYILDLCQPDPRTFPAVNQCVQSAMQLSSADVFRV